MLYAEANGTFRGRDMAVRSEMIKRIQSGEDDLADWDTEELLRGRRRAKDGSFKGRPVEMVPREIHDELARRVKTQVAHELRDWIMKQARPIMDRVAALHEIEDAERFSREKQALDLQIKAVQDMLDRFVIGRTESVEIQGTLKHEMIMDEVTVSTHESVEAFMGEWDDDVVDAEVVEEDDGDDWFTEEDF